MFPARYAQGYAYLRSKVYGDRPGKFMGDDDVRLWMPRRLVATDDPQANYLTGYGNGRFYLALSNESTEARNVTVTLDRERIPYAIDRRYSARVWTDGKPAGTTAVVNGKVTLQLSPKGLTAIAVDELPVFTRLQADYFDGEQRPASTDSGFRTDKTPVGNATAMFLSFAGRHEFYLWTSASDSDVRAARLTFKDGQGSERTLDRRAASVRVQRADRRSRDDRLSPAVRSHGRHARRRRPAFDRTLRAALSQSDTTSSGGADALEEQQSERSRSRTRHETIPTVRSIATDPGRRLSATCRFASRRSVQSLRVDRAHPRKSSLLSGSIVVTGSSGAWPQALRASAAR